MNKDQQEYEKLKQDIKNEKTLLYLYEQLKITKHDLKHDYQLLQYYLTEKDYSRVQELMSSKKDIVDSMPTLLSTHNKLLNTVINGKILEAYSKNIKVESVISIHDINFIHDYDLNTLLSNVLDNAIENNNEGIIRINIVQDNMLLHIKVGNAVNPQKYSPELITQKDNQNHGFGLKSINRIVKKYQGVMNIIHNQEEFEIQITLLMQ
ncbi:sensor histidine kinase [Longibaculum muris]|nr:GHKL domain-containing protein [Longibaculum muris]